MSLCQKCANANCNHAVEPGEIVVCCGAFKPPMTNADHIRAMSDEELVVFLDEFSGRCLDCAEDAKNKNCPIYKEGHYCRPKDIMAWLQQPAEEDE